MKTTADLTIGQIRLLVDGTPQAAALDYLLAESHKSRLVAVQKLIDFACNELEQYKHKKQGQGEDSITLEICSMLKIAGLQAEHDSDVGGHCDIVVRGKDSFLWIAEAKEHSNYSWLDKGFQQLSTRYSTGVPGQDNGEVIVYCYSQDAKSMIEKWINELTKRNPNVKIEGGILEESLIFRSEHKHAASGLPFHVRHKAVALYWSPKDK